MKKRLTQTARAKYEARLKTLLVKAFQEEGKVGSIVDAVGPEEASIKGVVEKLMTLMQAENGAGKYSVASLKKQKALAFLKKANEFLDGEETPLEEAHDLENPIMHPLEDLEHEIQTMDDDQLINDVELLEHHMKQDLGEEMPPDFGIHNNEEMPQNEMPPQEEQMMELNPEQKMALLLHAPAQVKKAKAASLRALAGVLEDAALPVSNNADGGNDIDNTHGEIADHYESQEAGSMIDSEKPAVNAAELNAKVKTLVAAFAAKDDSSENAAIMKLALQVLSSELESDEANDEKATSEEKKDEGEAEKTEEAKGAFPNDESEDAHTASMNEKKAILRAKLEQTKRGKEVVATVDGRVMKTPKEIPSPEGTSEDVLSGDAPIQYQTATSENADQQIFKGKQKVPGYKPTAGTDEPNEVYQGNTPESNKEVDSSNDSSKNLNKERALKDMEPAVQKAEPNPQNEMIDHNNAGTHQDAQEWEKVKNESDTTPKGERVIHSIGSLDKEISKRVTRAMSLVTMMADKGLIETNAQFTEKIIKFASMNDEKFDVAQETIKETATPSVPVRTAALAAPPSPEDEEQPIRHVASLQPRSSSGIENPVAKPVRRDGSEVSGVPTGLLARAISSAPANDNPMVERYSTLREGFWTAASQDDSLMKAAASGGLPDTRW